MEDDPQWDFRKISDETPLAFSCIENGKVRFFENPYLPMKEVVDQILPLKEKICIVVIPPCSPETIKILTAGLPVLNRIIIIDANEDRLKAWAKKAKPFNFKNVSTLLFTKDHITDKDNFTNIFPRDFAPLTLWKVALYFPAGYQSGEQTFISYTKEVLNLAKQSLTTKIKYHAGDMWHHMLNQLATIGDQAITKHTFKQDNIKRPFVIVGAGPSLDCNIEILKEYQDRVVILCCERAIGTMKAHNIKPDFILTVENVLGMWFHFEQHYDFIKDVPLISPFIVSHVVARNYPADKIFVKVKDLENWVDELGDFVPTELGNCVGQFGFHVAEALNPSKIILIGNDLAYKDGRSHTVHTHSDGELKNVLKTKGFYGGEIETSRTFRFYIEGFQSMICKCKVPVINATEGGAFIQGAKHAALENTLKSLPKQCYSLEYTPIASEKADIFYNKIIKDIFQLHKTIYSKQSELNKLDPNDPKAFFAFIPDNLQILINHFINPEFFLRYYDIIENYHPMRFKEYVEIVRLLFGMSLYACEYILNINIVTKYQEKNEKNVLILQPETKDLRQITDNYPELTFTVLPAMGQLTKIWETIVVNKIGTVICFDRQISPDTWTIPRIKCIDIHDGKLGRYHPVESYTVAAMTEDQIRSWPKQLRANVPADTLDNILSKL